MATLLDHTRKTKTVGTVDSLIGFMVTDQISAYKKMGHNPKAIIRVSEALVRSAIRRNGRTDAQQELRMNETERNQWEANNPIPE